jgi:hypothetical protein
VLRGAAILDKSEGQSRQLVRRQQLLIYSAGLRESGWSVVGGPTVAQRLSKANGYGRRISSGDGRCGACVLAGVV